MSKLKIGVVGAGYWGPNLIRNFAACPWTEVAAVCDASPERRHAVARRFGGLATVESLDRLLECGLDAVAIATPVSTHEPIARRCLEAGLHVLVEKPLAASTAQGQALVALARRLGRVLMVDHTYLFTNAVRRIKQLVDQGELGELYYIDGVRINLGQFQRDVNVVWDLAPHDFAIVDYVLGRPAQAVAAWGGIHAGDEHESLAHVHVDYGDRLVGHFHVNWLSPVKIRQMIFAGSRQSLVFNELDANEPVKVYDRGIELRAHELDPRQLQIGYRTGDVWSPQIPPGEALQQVVQHFAECIQDEAQPISDGALGVRVLQMLEATDRSLASQGRRQSLGEAGLIAPAV